MRDFITVVSGLPRSGTSLMMQMLEAGGMPILTDGVRAPDEDNPRGYFEYEPVKKTKHDASWVIAAAGKAVKVVYLLLRDLPAEHQYRVILMQRDINEVLASQQAMLERTGREGASISTERLASIFEAELRSITGWLSRRPNFRLREVRYRDCLESPTAAANALDEFLNGLNTGAMAAVVDPSLFRSRSAGYSGPQPFEP